MLVRSNVHWRQVRRYVTLSWRNFGQACNLPKLIRFFVEQSLSSYVSFLESDSDYVLWLSINKEAFQTDQDIFIGAIYISPHDLKFYNPNETE